MPEIAEFRGLSSRAITNNQDFEGSEDASLPVRSGVPPADETGSTWPKIPNISKPGVSGGFIRLPAETPDTTQWAAVVGVFHQQHMNLHLLPEQKNLGGLFDAYFETS